MYSGNDNSFSRNGARRRLPVEWLEPADALMVLSLSPKACLKTLEKRRVRAHGLQISVLCRPGPLTGLRDAGIKPQTRSSSCPLFQRSTRPSFRAFTILEMMIVIGIIGLIAAMALPHLSGFTKGNTVTAATRQFLDDVGLARQRAMVNRSEVCMVFLPPDFWTNDQSLAGALQYFTNSQMTTLVGHQYAAYALISTRTVGDQPGISNAHYLTDWKILPQGIYIYPWQLTNGFGTNWISTTNTTIGGGLSNGWPVTAFANNIRFPFPSTFPSNSLYPAGNYNRLPYIGFSPSGQLVSGSDQFIALSSGSIFIPPDAAGNPQWNPNSPNGTQPTETPLGCVSNNPVLIHIDWLTARAKLERNQF